MKQSQVQIVRFSKENPNWEKALEGKWGKLGEDWGSITIIKNIVQIVAFKGAKASVTLPEVYDGFLICSDGSIVTVENSTLNLNLGEGISAQGVLQLTKDN